MSDTVERPAIVNTLRWWARWAKQYTTYDGLERAFNEAADEIERLRGEAEVDDGANMNWRHEAERIRTATIEECAKIVESAWIDESWHSHFLEIATAIRALKEQK